MRSQYLILVFALAEFFVSSSASPLDRRDANTFPSCSQNTCILPRIGTEADCLANPSPCICGSSSELDSVAQCIGAACGETEMKQVATLASSYCALQSSALDLSVVEFIAEGNAGIAARAAPSPIVLSTSTAYAFLSCSQSICIEPRIGSSGAQCLLNPNPCICGSISELESIIQCIAIICGEAELLQMADIAYLYCETQNAVLEYSEAEWIAVGKSAISSNGAPTPTASSASTATAFPSCSENKCIVPLSGTDCNQEPNNCICSGSFDAKSIIECIAIQCGDAELKQMATLAEVYCEAQGSMLGYSYPDFIALGEQALATATSSGSLTTAGDAGGSGSTIELPSHATSISGTTRPGSVSSSTHAPQSGATSGVSPNVDVASKKSDTGAIAGGAIGGVIAGIVLIAGLVAFCRRSRDGRIHYQEEMPRPPPSTSVEQPAFYDGDRYPSKTHVPTIAASIPSIPSPPRSPEPVLNEPVPPPPPPEMRVDAHAAILEPETGELSVNSYGAHNELPSSEVAEIRELPAMNYGAHNELPGDHTYNFIVDRHELL